MRRIAMVSIFALFAYQPLAHALEPGAEVGDHVEKGMGGHEDKGNLGGRHDKGGDHLKGSHEDKGMSGGREEHGATHEEKSDHWKGGHEGTQGSHEDKWKGREERGDRWRDGHGKSGHGITLNFRQRHEHYYDGRGGYDGGDVYHHHYVHHVYGPDVVPSGRRSKSYCPCRSGRHH